MWSDPDVGSQYALRSIAIHEKIKVVLDLITFLTNDKSASSNVKSLENIMETNDIELYKILDC